MTDNATKKRILIVAAHPDDEVLGCGGTIARHSGCGDEIMTIFLADGVGARASAPPPEQIDARRGAGNAAARALGTNAPIYFDFPDNRLDSVSLLDLVQAIEHVAEDYLPDVVYTHHSGDLNVDHRVCHQAVQTAFRPAPAQTVHSIYGFEVPSSTEWMFADQSRAFQPTHFVDISAYLGTKLDALDCYEMEMRPFPHPRSKRAIEALATWRGATIGCQLAEAFTVIRQRV